MVLSSPVLGTALRRARLADRRHDGGPPLRLLLSPCGDRRLPLRRSRASRNARRAPLCARRRPNSSARLLTPLPQSSVSARLALYLDHRWLSALVRGWSRPFELVPRRVHRRARKRCGRDELEATIAHELAHVRRRDVLVQTFAVLFAATLLESSRLGGWFSRVLLYIFAPIAAAFVNVLLSPKRELQADALAARVTGTGTRSGRRPSRLDRASELIDVRRITRNRAPLRSRPLRGRGHCAHVQDPSTFRNPSAPPPRARCRRRSERRTTDVGGAARQRRLGRPVRLIKTGNQSTSHPETPSFGHPIKGSGL